MRVQSIEALDKAAAERAARPEARARPPRCCRRAASIHRGLKSQLKPGGKGEIRLVLALEDRGREMEFVIPGRYDVSPARAGVLATVPGVIEILEI